MENEEQEQQVETKKPMTLRTLFENKRLLITLLVILLGIVLTVVFLKIAPKIKKTPPPTVSVPKNYTGSIHFLAQRIDVASVPTERTIDIIIESPFGSLAGVTLGIQYDPKFVEVTNFALNNSTTSFFGKDVKLTDLRANFGESSKTSISLILPSTVTERKGSGTIGAITFKIKNMAAGTATLINFTGETDLVTRFPGAKFTLTKIPLLITMQGVASPLKQ